jgi:membrane AbrB-like protein
LALFGLTSVPAATRPAGSPDLVELAILAIASTAAAVALLRLRVPGGLMFGAMAASGLLHGSGFIHAAPPWWLTGAAVITLGAVAGSRFANTTPRMLAGYLGAAFGSFAVAIAVASGFVLVLTSVAPLPIADVVVAFAPGAQDTMMVLALALHLDPVYVGAHHLVRFLIVNLTVPVLAARIAKRAARPRRGRDGWPSRRGTFDD